MENIRIEKLRAVTPQVHERVQCLLADLYPSRPLLSREAHTAVLEQENVFVYIALCGDEIVGTATLASYRKLGGYVWVIEDVVVDAKFRAHGIGTRLTHVLLDEARNRGAEFVDVYSRHEKAPLFYHRCGFADRNVNRPLYALRYTFPYGGVS